MDSNIAQKYVFAGILMVSALLSILSIDVVSAAGEGTIIIEQIDTEYQGVKRLGKWGLGTPTGTAEGTTEKFTSSRVSGNYTLTVSPADGAVSTITVIQDGVEKSTTESRTAKGVLGSGGTLAFKIRYAFTRVGIVNVSSDPSDIPFKLRGPAGVVYEGKTPESYTDVVEGSYTVSYFLPKECKPPLPISRNLKEGSRVSFSTGFNCSVLYDDEEEEEEPVKEPVKKPVKEPVKEPVRKPRTAPVRAPQSPVRISLSSGSSEVPSGGTSRLSLTVLNQGDIELNNLTVDMRFDSSQLSMQGIKNNGVASNNQVSWTIPSIPAGGKWETSVAGKVAASVPNGSSVSTTVTVSGNDLNEIPLSQRSSSTQFGVLKKLPETGAAWDVLMLMVGIALITFGFVGAGVQGLVQR